MDTPYGRKPRLQIRLQLHCLKLEGYDNMPTFSTKLLNTSCPNPQSHQSLAQVYLSFGWALSWLGVLPCHWSAGRCVYRRSVDSSGCHRIVGLVHVHHSGC